MGLDARKPVFGGLWTTQAQASLRICAVWSVPLLFAFCKVAYVNLLQVKFQFSSYYLYLRRLVWNLLCQKPQRQVFSRWGSGESWHVRSAKIQISLHIYTIWLEPQFSVWKIIVPFTTYRAPIKDSDQIAWMRRLIWVFEGNTTCKLVSFSWHLLRSLSCKWWPWKYSDSRVKSGKFGRSAKFVQRHCLFHILIIVMKNKLKIAQSENPDETAH